MASRAPDLSKIGRAFASFLWHYKAEYGII